MLRIITGTAKGKRIDTLEGEATRPTSERIKEAVFSSIQFDIENRRVLDLFAGSGQLGLEALSRGAVSATFVDASREAMEIVKKNATRTGFFDASKYLVSDFRNYIRKASGRVKFDLVFIDPPYSMQCCGEAVRRLADAELLEGGAIVVLESGDEEIDTASLVGFEVIKSTHYGKKTFVNVLLYRGAEK
ncbi:MAG: 16S rRNA (guanine(966)-N(2))-methyltransferase RsmD [Clostridia bacterium]|nr:16S rRNA (guanine(966)-N(2))-methyltransferase RsmD [Clostridia bacterium]